MEELLMLTINCTWC